MNYCLFSDIWDSALKAKSREDFHSLWSQYGIADAFTLDTTYNMAYGGIRAIRSAVELTQRDFADQYELPRRSVENWESGLRTPPPYVVKHLGYAVLTDTLALRKEFVPVGESRSDTVTTP